eukprot:NODE_22002_length_726_cov_3.691152.p1 GENE.NODE_22002_length_726_cov_3.691152~~NODE_22002_length_726_cov_3.691152.p1  ORF type:complete len:118 (+),score=25.69 NODE_22002_length_726_cov_3.691152:269-622(+)
MTASETCTARPILLWLRAPWRLEPPSGASETTAAPPPSAEMYVLTAAVLLQLLQLLQMQQLMQTVQVIVLLLLLLLLLQLPLLYNAALRRMKSKHQVLLLMDLCVGGSPGPRLRHRE